MIKFTLCMVLFVKINPKKKYTNTEKYTKYKSVNSESVGNIILEFELFLPLYPHEQMLFY